MTILNSATGPLLTAPSVTEPLRALPGIRVRNPQMTAVTEHKDTLLREMHHRVGNSLQIVASLLALDARKMHPGQERQHLENAHRRILAVATLQKQLQTQREGGKLELAAYLRQLCANLTASVVGDTTRIAIDIQADAGTVSSTVATNMGLIVTELVINALKHAFQSDADSGRITDNLPGGQAWLEAGRFRQRRREAER